MKKILLVASFAVCNQISIAQTGKVGINTNTPQAVLHVKDSSVLFSGAVTLPLQPGNPPEEGQGIRMMWYPDKAAFRTGFIYANYGAKENIGNYSFATGVGTLAAGSATSAFGNFTTASGANSSAFGVGTQANGFGSLVVGAFNQPLTTTGQTSMAFNTPLFIVGNGDDNTTRKNALTVLKSGYVGIGIDQPQFGLHVAHNTAGNDGHLLGIMLESTNPDAGEVGINFKNRGTSGTGNNMWTVGLKELSRNLSFNYGSSFDLASTKMVLDSIGRLGLGVIQPHKNALLDLTSTNKGLLLPRMGSSQVDAINPEATAKGLVVYDTVKKFMYLFDGSDWRPLAYLAEDDANISATEYIRVADSSADQARAGTSVFINDKYAVYGAPNWKPNADSSGQVAVYQNAEGYLVPSDIQSSRFGQREFGRAVCVNGNMLAVSYISDPLHSAQDGAIRIFIIDPAGKLSPWSIVGSPFIDAGFGASFDFKGDFLAAIAPASNKIFIFRREENQNFELFQTITSSQTPKEVKLANDKLIFSTSSTVYLYRYNGQSWVAAPQISLPVSTPHTIQAISMDGKYIAISAAEPISKVFIYKTPAELAPQAPPIAVLSPPFTSQNFGKSLSLSGEYLVVGSPSSSVDRNFVYHYKLNGNQWLRVASVQPSNIQLSSNMQFGNSVHSNGRYYIAGAPFFITTYTSSNPHTPGTSVNETGGVIAGKLH